MKHLPTRFTLNEVQQRCAQEQQSSSVTPPGWLSFCFELFRRALVERNAPAWAMICEQYHRLMLSWAKRNPTHAGDVEDIVQEAWAKFWRAVTPDIFSNFTGIGSVLSYLKRCVRSVRVDQTRAGVREERLWEALAISSREGDSSLERDVLTRDVHQQCLEHIYAQLTDAAERRVVYLSFALDLKPAEIASRYPEHFAAAREVSRIKERVLRRLGADPRLCRLYFGESVASQK
ncbi:MAG: sigma factor [Chloroflexota bacterium]|nr:sigma factor [Chloroflexota bacterium]